MKLRGTYCGGSKGNWRLELGVGVIIHAYMDDIFKE